MMRVGFVQRNAIVGALEKNREILQKEYESLCGKADLIVAPELFQCGYPPRDLLLRDDFLAGCDFNLNLLASSISKVPLLVGVIVRNPQVPGKPLFNSAMLMQNGVVTGWVRKSLLPTYDVFDEDRYFEPAKTIEPLEIHGRKVGVTICEDIWNDEDFWPERRYRRDPVRELIKAGAEVLINLGASPWHRGKEKTRFAMFQRVSRDEGVPLAAVNLIGANDELIFDGHSCAFDRTGSPLWIAPGFEEGSAVINLDSNNCAEAVICETFPKSATRVELAQERGEVVPKWPDPNEYLYKSLCLGTRDYMHKCGFSKAVLGLSGGIDSAVVAAIAAEALGPENVWGISMPSQYSSEGSISDADQLAENLGIRYDVLPIIEPVAAFDRLLSGIFAGTQPDIAEENIQSRLRGLTLMALSNKFGSLVLTTGNKSEIAVGYCTLYGDMCGALSVINDVLKTEVYELARYLNRVVGPRNGKAEIIPFRTIEKPPSAELRPDQKDEDSLPPYEVLDEILRLLIVEDKGRDEIVAAGFAEPLVRDVINKVTFSEYKRRQAAPGLKVSSRAFGIGRRIPVAQRFRS